MAYTLATNGISLAISAIVVLVVPKLIGIEEYGYWQLYLFYTSYVGFLHFGWNDGIYLRYGGKEYRDLDKQLLFSQFYMLAALQIVIAIIICLVTMVYVHGEARVFILYMTAMNMIAINVRYFFLFILQATNRIREYALITLLDRLIYAFLLALILLSGNRDFKFMIYSDLVARISTLVVAMFVCKEIAFMKISKFYFSTVEAKANLTAGIKLMIATISSMLVIGVVRFGIERTWDIQTFAKVSLTISISNLLMVFVNTIGIVLYPILRRTQEIAHAKTYKTIRGLLLPTLYGFLLFFYPFKMIFLHWLVGYEESFRLMSIFFPILVFEGHMSLLINTFYKVKREEGLLLKINLITLAMSVILTVITTFILRNLELSIVAIVFLLAFRCYYAEHMISKLLSINFDKQMFIELLLATIFIMASWFLPILYGLALYAIAYIVYLVVQRKNLSSTYNEIRTMIAKN